MSQNITALYDKVTLERRPTRPHYSAGRDCHAAARRGISGVGAVLLRPIASTTNRDE